MKIIEISECTIPKVKWEDCHIVTIHFHDESCHYGIKATCPVCRSINIICNDKTRYCSVCGAEIKNN